MTTTIHPTILVCFSGDEMFGIGVLDPHEYPEIEFGDVKVTATVDLEAYESFKNEDVHKDGWLYPPVFVAYSKPSGCQSEGVEIRNTRRPARMFRMFPTHQMIVPEAQPADEKRTVASLALNLIGFTLGARLQFSDWYNDTRIRIACRPPFVCGSDELSRFLEIAWTSAKGLDRENQELLLRILHLYCRTPTYEWEWERFTWLYSTADACWRFLNNTGRINCNNASHSQRLRTMCENLGIPDDSEKLRDIVQLRNNLIHEVTWDGKLPEHGGSRTAFASTIQLEKLVTRVLIGCLGVKCGFITTGWWTRSTIGLDLE